MGLLRMLGCGAFCLGGGAVAVVSAIEDGGDVLSLGTLGGGAIAVISLYFGLQGLGGAKESTVEEVKGQLHGMAREQTDSKRVSRVEGVEGRLTTRKEGKKLANKLDETEARLLAAITASLPPTDLPDQAVMSLAERIVAETDGDEALALAELERAVEVAREMRKAGASLANLDGFVASVVSRMVDLNDEGDADAADREYEAALAQMEREEAEAADRRREAKAALITQGIGQAYLRRDVAMVARREERKAALMASGAELFEALRAVQDGYYETGERMGTRFDLQIGVALAERCVQLADTPEAGAMAQNDLGLVLQVLGERGEAGALERSVAAYEAVLSVCTKEALPAQWAATQNNLGVVLCALGERGEAGVLERSAAAYGAALSVRTKEAMPADWAATQNNLGIVLRVLGERGKAGALERSVTAFEAALSVYTKEVMPADWAMTQNSLGVVLCALGERGEAGALERSVTAFEAALSVRTKEAMPAQWAMTQLNLAMAYEVMAAQGGDGRAVLERGLEAVQGALEVYRVQGMSFYVGEAEPVEARLREALAGLG